MNIHFYLQQKRKSKEHQIFLVITDPLFKPLFKYYTGEKIKPGDWNKNKERAKGGYAHELNAYLDALEKKAKDLRLQLKSEDNFSRDSFEMEFNKDKVNAKVNLWSRFDRWVEECKDEDSTVTEDKLSERTIQSYVTLKNILLEYEELRKIKLSSSSFDKKFYSDFKKFILTERLNPTTKKYEGSINTFSGHIKNLKKFLKWLSIIDRKVNPAYTLFKKKYVKAEDKPFRESEIVDLYNHKWTYSLIKKIYSKYSEDVRANRKANIISKLETLERARLILLFLCSSGKRISDYVKMEAAEFDEEIIRFKAKKNQVVCYVPNFDDLYFRPVQIVSEMMEKFGCLPKVSGQKLNDAIKELFELIGFDRFKPTSKTGRKTYATLKVKMGINPEIVMLSTGHKSRKSFDSYLTMDEFDVIKENREKAVYMKAI